MITRPPFSQARGTTNWTYTPSDGPWDNRSIASHPKTCCRRVWCRSDRLDRPSSSSPATNWSLSAGLRNVRSCLLRFESKIKGPILSVPRLLTRIGSPGSAWFRFRSNFWFGWWVGGLRGPRACREDWIRKEVPFVSGSSNVGYTPIGGENDHGSSFTLESSVEEREALHIEHVDLIDKKDTRHNLGFAFFSPLGHLLIDLLPHFLCDFSSSSGEEGQEALRSRVYYVDLVQSHCVDHLLSLLDFALGAVHETGLWAHGVIVGGSGEGSACLWDFAWSLINSDNVSSDYLLLLDGFDHLLPQIIDCLHFCGLQSDFAGLGARSWIAKTLLEDFSI